MLIPEKIPYTVWLQAESDPNIFLPIYINAYSRQDAKDFVWELMKETGIYKNWVICADVNVSNVPFPES